MLLYDLCDIEIDNEWDHDIFRNSENLKLYLRRSAIYEIDYFFLYPKSMNYACARINLLFSLTPPHPHTVYKIPAYFYFSQWFHINFWDFIYILI